MDNLPPSLHGDELRQLTQGGDVFRSEVEAEMTRLGLAPGIPPAVYRRTSSGVFSPAFNKLLKGGHVILKVDSLTLPNVAHIIQGAPFTVIPTGYNHIYTSVDSHKFFLF